MNNYSSALKFGSIAGTIMVVLLMLLYFIDMAKLASFWPMLFYIPLVFIMIWGGITIRKEIGGYKSLGQAFVMLLIISFTATFVFDTFGYILYKAIDPELPVILKQKAIENATDMMEKFGTPEDKMEEALQQMEAQDYTPTAVSQLIRYATSLGVGALFSLLIGVFVRRNDQSTAT
jgi:hypothetical protein